MCQAPYVALHIRNLLEDHLWGLILKDPHRKTGSQQDDWLSWLCLETRCEPNLATQLQNLCPPQLYHGASVNIAKQEHITRSLPSSKPVIHRFSPVPLHTSMPSPLPTASQTSFHTTDLEVPVTDPCCYDSLALSQRHPGNFDISFLSLHNKPRE